MDPDCFDHFTALEFPLLLFLGSAHKHSHSQREAAASPLPSLLSRLFVFGSYHLCPAQSRFYFQCFFSAQTFPDSLRKASNPKDQSCKEVNIGAKMVENWGKAVIKLGRALQYIWKERKKDHIPCLGTERVGRPGYLVECHALIPEAQGRQDRISLYVLGD